MRRGTALVLVLGVVSAARAQEQTLQLPHERPPEERKAPVLTQTPALLRFVPAVYPPAAEKAGLTARVGLEIDIGADGRVTGVRVEKPAGHGFDEAAAAAARQFVFSPAKLDGKPAPVTIGYVYRFVLRRAPPPPPPARERKIPVEGRVLERASKNPLTGATIAAEGIETTAGAGGRFSLQVPAGMRYFQVFAAGYEPLTRRIAVEGQKLTLTFYLRPKIEGFHTVVRTTKETDVVEEYTLEKEEVRRAPGTFGDPLHVITDLPGVARSPFDLGFLIVRGADPADTDFYLDGLEVPLIYHFGGGPAVVNPEFLDEIDFYPGGQGARYGHAIGGTVDVTSHKLQADRVHGTADVNTAFASGFLDVPLGDDTTIAAAGRRSYFDLLLKPFLGPGVAIVPYFWDYQFKIDHGKPTDRNQFNLMAYGSNDTLDVATGSSALLPGGVNLDYHALFHHLTATWQYQNGPFKSKLAGMAGYEDTNLGFVQLQGNTYQDVLALRHDMSYEITPRWRLEFGEDVQDWITYYALTIPTIPDYVVFPGSSVAQGNQSISRVFHLVDVGPWVQGVLQLGGGVKLVPGLRLDYYHVPFGDREDVEPRLELEWQILRWLTAKASAGLYDEPPTVEYFDAEFGTPGLGLLSAWQYSGGFDLRILPPLSLSLIGFYTDRFNLVGGFFGPNAPGVANFNNLAQGRAYGLEVYLKHDFTARLFGWLSYTLSRSDLTMGPNVPWGLSAWDETHILTVLGSYTIGAGWTVGARFRLVTGLPMTPITNSTYDADQDTYIPIYGVANSARLPLFRQLDVRVDKEFPFDTWKLDVYLDCWNVTDAQNEEGLIYDYRYRTYTILPSYPILPMFGVRGDY